VTEPRELPDVPPNAALLAFLRGQASPPSGPGDYTLGSWQLHTHPDLMALLQNLAPGWPLTAAYGIPLLASEGIAALAAFGTDYLAVRVDHLPAGVETEDIWGLDWVPCTRDGWHIITPWQDRLKPGEIGPVLERLAAEALAHAARLRRAGSEPGDEPSAESPG
jgi:hypothetical protein